LILSLLLCFFTLAEMGSPANKANYAQSAYHEIQSNNLQYNSESRMGLEILDKADIQEQKPVAANKKKASADDTDYGLIVNIILTLVTLVIAVAGLIQAIAAKKSADIAMNSQRSWVISESVDSPDFADPWIQRFGCHFKIIGSSPVRVKEANFRVRVVDARERPVEHGAKPRLKNKEPNLPDTPDYGNPTVTLAHQPEMGRVRPPGEDFVVVPTLDSLFLFEAGTGEVSGAKDAKAIKNGDKFLCAYGFIRYSDAFSQSKTRETRFCYIYNVKNPANPGSPDVFEIGGPPAYNDVMEFIHPAVWKRVMNKAIKFNRKNQTHSKKAN